MRPIECLEFLIDAAGAGRSTRESVDRLELSGRIAPEHAPEVAAAIRGFVGAEGWTVSVLDGEFEPLSPDAVGGEDVNLIFSKPSGGRLFFATVDGFRAALRDPALSHAAEVHVLGTSEPFATRRFRVVPWDGTPLPPLPAATPEPSAEPTDPRRGLVRDLTGVELSEDTLRWLPAGGDGAGAVWETWRAEAARRLALLSASEVWSEAGALKVCMHGARKRTFDFDADSLDCGKAFAPLTEAAEWLVLDRGAEARHEMLVRRLAAIVPESDSWCRTIPGLLREALEGAKIDYRAYARSKSAETLKAMADLRKAVGDDVGRIVERSQRLSNGFVASVAALAAGLGVRLALVVSKGDGGTGGFVFGVAVLAVMWAGVCLQRRVSDKSLRDDLRNMRKWHRSVHVALSRTEYGELALKPVLDALRLYRDTAGWTRMGLYIASVLFLGAMWFLPTMK